MMLLSACSPKSVPIRFEFQIAPKAKILSKVKTIGELKERFNKLKIVKYVYIDPVDKSLKGVNPPSDVPLVENAYITVIGTISDIKALTKEATK